MISSGNPKPRPGTLGIPVSNLVSQIQTSGPRREFLSRVFAWPALAQLPRRLLANLAQQTESMLDSLPVLQRVQPKLLEHSEGE